MSVCVHHVHVSVCVQTHMYLGMSVEVRGQPQAPVLTYTSFEIVSYGANYVSQGGCPASGGGVSCLSLPSSCRSAEITDRSSHAYLCRFWGARFQPSLYPLGPMLRMLNNDIPTLTQVWWVLHQHWLVDCFFQKVTLIRGSPFPCEHSLHICTFHCWTWCLRYPLPSIFWNR